MGSTEFGNFQDFCRDSTLPVCNLLSDRHDQNGWGGCELRGIGVGGDSRLTNLGSILLAAIAFVTAGFLVFKSEKKRAAVGRREMQLFLIGFALISLCEIFSVGGIPGLGPDVRIGFTAAHIGLIIATTWLLMLNAVVGYQLIDDGTMLSIGLALISAAALLVGTGYVALDTGFSWTGFWDDSYSAPNRNIALYVLYQLVPLIFLVAFYVLETILVLRVLGEIRPMIWLTAAAILFAAGQVFNYVASKYICDGTSGKIDGALFQTLFTLLSVVMIWIFWASITEDDWPTPVGTAYP